MNLKSLKSVLMAVAVLAATMPQAHANAVLELISGGTKITGTLQAPGIYGINFMSINGWTVEFASGSTVPATGTLALPIDDISSFNVMHSGNSPLYIEFSANGFTTPTPGTMLAGMSGENVGTGLLAGSYSTYFGPGNTLFTGTTANPLPTSGLLTSNVFSTTTNFIGSATGIVTGGDPFSLTQVIEITQGLGSLDDTLSAVPPSPSVPDGGLTVIMLGGAFLGLSLLRKKS